MHAKFNRHHALLAASLALAGCGDDGPSSLEQVPSQLAFLSQPGPVEAGEAMDPAVAVEVQDASGRRVGDAEVPVTLSLGQSPDGAALSGTKTVRSAGGVASFTGLSLDSAATGYTLTARASDLAGAESSLFEVVPGPAATLEVSPASARLNAIGATLQLDATVRDRVGNAVPGVELMWSSADSDVATVDEEGRVVSVAEGDVAITAEGAGFEGHMTLEVEQVAATVTVTPPLDTLAEGETVELRAVAADSNGVELSDAEVAWESEAPAVAAVRSTGPGVAEIEALRGGPARVTASVDEHSGAANIEVLRKIVFGSNRDGPYEIYIMNADGSGQTNLTNHRGGDYEPAWSPDGSRIAFRSNRDGFSEIYVMDADGSGQTRLTINSAVGFAWSPDGSRIVFISYHDGDRDIYVMNSDGSGKRKLTNNNAIDSQPAWSPEGSRMAFMSRQDGDSEIYVMNSDGSGKTNLTNNTAGDLEPTWSPDGSRIAFRSHRDGNAEIYVMNADGSGQTRLTNNSGFDLNPVWSPDGSRIAFMRSRDGDYEYYVMNADGSGNTQLTNNSAGLLGPVWSPDGSRIAFSSSRDGNDEIYLMKADGSGKTRLTTSPESDIAPAWRPDPQP